ncbi:MAG: protein kinase [Planctomycetota bacterium]
MFVAGFDPGNGGGGVGDLPSKLSQYMIERELGRGGMGVVYLARDPQLDRQVAIKVLPESMSENRERLARFVREARMVGKLNHPNVASVYALQEHLGRQMLVMEYVEGVNLAERLDTGMALTVGEALQIGAQTAAGLEAAHARGVVHRDLKPANIRLRRDGMVKVLDFGLAKPEADAHGAGDDSDETMSLAATEAGRVLGTAGYMSPEQARGKAVDKRTDVWAFGCVLFECLTSVRAFGGETAMDAMVAVLERQPPWEKLPEAVPDRVLDLLQRCLEKDVDRRSRDIGDVRLQLEDALADDSRGARFYSRQQNADDDPTRAPGDAAKASGFGSRGFGTRVSATAETQQNALGLNFGVPGSGGSGSGSAGSGSGVSRLASPTNLKAQLTRFVGRDELIADVLGLLGEQRLVTLIGAAGCGKTRLAMEGAARRAAEHRGGVWIIELGGVTDPEHVPGEVAAVLGVPLSDGTSAADQLVVAMAGRETLLLFDNCEHMLDAVGGLVARLLSVCPGVRVLTTSREALGLPGENVLSVPPMLVPAQGDERDAERVEQNEAVRLFLDRARAVRPRFALSPSAIAPVVRICRELDGIPLAIELAAARVKLLSVEQIAERLGQRFKLLRGGQKSAPTRQQTLLAAIDWSYDQLDAAEKAAMRRLCVFGSGFTLGAAEAVCAGEYAEHATPGDLNEDSVLEEWEVIDLVGQLLDKSLLFVDETHGDAGSGEPRYRMLETVRQFGLLKLSDADESAEANTRHLSWMVELADAAGAGLAGPDQAEWFAQVGREQASIRAALAWVLDGGGDLEHGRRVAAGVWRFWAYRGHMVEGRRLLTRLDAASEGGAPTAAWARLREAISWTAMLIGDLGSAIAFGRAGLEMAWAVDDPLTVSNLLNCLGAACHGEGRTDEAADYFEQSLAIRRRLGERHLAAACLNNLGECQRQVGDLDRARELYREAAATIGGGRDVLLRATIAQNLAWLSIADGDPTTAQEHLETGLGVLTAMNADGEVPAMLELAACIAGAMGAHARAVTLFAAAGQVRDQQGSPPRPSVRRDFEPWLRASFDALGASDLSRARAEGMAMALGNAVRFAVATPDDAPGDAEAPR